MLVLISGENKEEVRLRNFEAALGPVSCQNYFFSSSSSMGMLFSMLVDSVDEINKMVSRVLFLSVFICVTNS